MRTCDKITSSFLDIRCRSCHVQRSKNVWFLFIYSGWILFPRNICSNLYLRFLFCSEIWRKVIFVTLFIFLYFKDTRIVLYRLKKLPIIFRNFLTSFDVVDVEFGDRIFQMKLFSERENTGPSNKDIWSKQVEALGSSTDDSIYGFRIGSKHP